MRNNVFLITILLLGLMSYGQESKIFKINDKVQLKVTEVGDVNDQSVRYFVLDEDFKFKNRTLDLNVPAGSCMRYVQSDSLLWMVRGDTYKAPTGSFSFHIRTRTDCYVNIGEAQNLKDTKINLDGSWKRAYVHFNKKMQIVGFQVYNYNNPVLMSLPSSTAVKYETEKQNVVFYGKDMFRNSIYYVLSNPSSSEISFGGEYAMVYSQKVPVRSVLYSKDSNTGLNVLNWISSSKSFYVPIKNGGKLLYVGWDDVTRSQCQIKFGPELVVESYGNDCLVIY